MSFHTEEHEMSRRIVPEVERDHLKEIAGRLRKLSWREMNSLIEGFQKSGVFEGDVHDNTRASSLLAWADETLKKDDAEGLAKPQPRSDWMHGRQY